MQIKETDLSEVSNFVNHVLNATASDKSDTSVSIIKINFLAIVINFLESPKERKLQSDRQRKGKRIYMIYLKFISHFSFSSLPSQIRSRSVVNPL